MIKTLRLTLLLMVVLAFCWIPLSGQLTCSGGVCIPHILNAPTGFTGKMLDLQLATTSLMSYDPSTKTLTLSSAGSNDKLIVAGNLMNFNSIGTQGATTFSLSAANSPGVTLAADRSDFYPVSDGSASLGVLHPFNIIKGTTYQTATNCSSSASPAVCAAAASGSVVIAAAATTVTVNTTAVTANSQITLQDDSGLGTKLGVTCNTQALGVLGTPRVTARTASTSFAIAIDVGPTTNPLCLSYNITN